MLKLSEIKTTKTLRISSGFSEFDRVLGGGIVPGSIILVAGDPGIGKSTLLLETALKVAKGSLGDWNTRSLGKENSRNPVAQKPSSLTVLYVTGEESAQQVKIRADRIVGEETESPFDEAQGKQRAGETKSVKSKFPDNLYILPETDLAAILDACEQVTPDLIIVDSIQTLTWSELSGSAGSVGQVRECAQVLQRLAKKTKIPIILVGHVTKEGSIAGPKTLEHLVDCVLNMEGESLYAFRLLRSVKNRFGSTFEVGVFEMHDTGLTEAKNPSEIFLAERIKGRAGSAVSSTLAGGRPIVCEVQALCTPTAFGLPTRRVSGLDISRVQIIIASLIRSANLPLGTMDVFVNVAGGLRVTEPASDLSVALAIYSAAVNKPLKENLCSFGEVGLLGELRQVGNVKVRLAEAKRLGFSHFVTPEKFRTLEQALAYAVV